MGTLARDVRFAVRVLLKTPLVTVAAIVSLALGIGANTAIFSLIHATFLRSLPIEDPDRVVAIYMTEERQGGGFGGYSPMSRPNFEDLRERVRGFDHVVNLVFFGAGLVAEGGEPEQVGGVLVSTDYFEMLGTGVAAGRLFRPEAGRTPATEVPGSRPEVVLGHELWQQRFAGDPEVVGRTLRLNGHAFTVVGVAEEGFRGTFRLGGPDLWVPMPMYESLLSGTTLDWFDDRRASFTLSLGRLAEGVGLEQARESAKAVAAALEEEFPVDNADRTLAVLPIAEAALNPNQRDGFVRAGGLLATVVGLVLLIACANAANLLLGRAAARRREIGVRLALGASRGRLIRQLLTESLVLATVAGAAGIVVAMAVRRALWAFRPPFLADDALDLSFDLPVLAFTLGLTLVTGLVFGLVPALRAARPRLVQELTQPASATLGSARLLSGKNLVVMGQVALSLVALVGSGLFLRSLGEALELDPGFRPDGLVTVTLSPATLGYAEDGMEAFFDRALKRAGAVPGVESATLASTVPMTAQGIWRTVLVDGRAETAENNRIMVPVTSVDDGYFSTLGIELRRGRVLDSRDRAGGVQAALVNEAMAELFWPGEDAIGRRFHFFGREASTEVVGVVETAKYGTLGEDPQPQAYLARRQEPATVLHLVARASGPQEAILGGIRGAVQDLEPELALTGVETLSESIAQALWPARLGARLLGLLALLALLLAAVGLYGVMAYGVSQRGREIGIRMAMGARRRDVLLLVLRQGLLVVAAGLVVGTLVAAFAGRAVESLLYGVSSTDPLTFAVAIGLFLVVGTVAILGPASRAARVNPVQVLRFER